MVTIQMATLQNAVIGSIFGIVLTASSGLAQSLPKSGDSGRVFSVPTFERQPLSQTQSTGEYWITVANNAFIAQDYLNSIAAYGKAIDLTQASDRSNLLEERGWVHYRLGQFERADEDFRRAASLHAQQEQWSDYNNVRQMQKFVSNQADRLDSAS